MYQRLKATLISSGVQEELDKEDKSISPYSFRHYYAYLRLINKVPIHLLAENMGTSVLSQANSNPQLALKLTG